MGLNARHRLSIVDFRLTIAIDNHQSTIPSPYMTHRLATSEKSGEKSKGIGLGLR
jgi:hypothetical protein